ncbi:triphosphoribosyl-dephospho-CoA synthase CitG [Alkaliphilus transvaalensis]|uniref:triphosphoribosyl-dephospho-CoA synthase CitG n=1 Tax=Alkaliphilus transvaalensis TaxID=114628 RepID=UPI00047B981E|nr:triphosphoribosyl-dephospho-CoA synthase CitG [Alkaliphilus transvaalensis]
MIKKRVYHIDERAFEIGNFAVEAILYEVASFPSPGLVSPVSNGAHRDMNFFTFIDSTVALSKYFTLFTQEGFSDASYVDVFNRIRSLGIEAEREMFEKTKGVNTHKGMLFLMGVSCGAVGKAIHEGKPFYEIKNIIKKMTAGIVEKELSTLVNKGKLTHGEGLYLKYKTKGIRGEVEAGIPTVFDFALDFYQKEAKGLSLNDGLVHTLLGIMQICEDSTILHRHSLEVLAEVQNQAKEIIDMGGMKTEAGRRSVDEISIEYIKRNISPGGSADLLAVTVFLDRVAKLMETLKKK